MGGDGPVRGAPGWLGPYEVLRELGAGGMGRVYLGRSPGGRLVAVKVVGERLLLDATARARFAQEAAAARAVSGAFTASVVDADPHGDPPWLATLYVPGPTLAKAVQLSGPLEEPEVWRLGAGLAEAVRAIHEAGVTHRDLKPANVLLAPDGPRVIDFGISLTPNSTRLTGPGMLVGTPLYMSPEQLRGAPVSPASDLFSLASVLVFAATGYPPFATDEGILHGTPRLEALPTGLRDTLARCLSRTPRNRPTAEELLAALVRARRVSRPPDDPDRTVTQVPPRRAPGDRSATEPRNRNRNGTGNGTGNGNGTGTGNGNGTGTRTGPGTPAETSGPAGATGLPDVRFLLASGLTDRMVREAVARVSR